MLEKQNAPKLLGGPLSIYAFRTNWLSPDGPNRRARKEAVKGAEKASKSLDGLCLNPPRSPRL